MWVALLERKICSIFLTLDTLQAKDRKLIREWRGRNGGV
jgi:hypothetical protein